MAWAAGKTAQQAAEKRVLVFIFQGERVHSGRRWYAGLSGFVQDPPVLLTSVNFGPE